MSEPSIYLKTQQVADALGVGVSTLKRWVDAGEIQASRTVGRHRLIALDEAIRFARRSNLATEGLERLGAVEVVTPIEVDDRVRGELVAALREGRGRQARRLVFSAHRALGGGASLGDRLIAPVLETIGHGWSVGDWDVFQEHHASHVVAQAIGDLIARAPAGGDAPAPVAFVASPGGDHYTIPNLLAELTLREGGWDVRNLGSDLPLPSMARGGRDDPASAGLPVGLPPGRPDRVPRRIRRGGRSGP